MQNLVFTQLSVPEVRQLLRDELEAYFADRSQPPVQLEATDIGGIELAETITGLKRPTIYGLVSERKIPHSKKGKRLYFSREELFDWLRQGKRKTQAEIAAEAASFVSNKQKSGNQLTTKHA